MFQGRSDDECLSLEVRQASTVAGNNRSTCPSTSQPVALPTQPVAPPTSQVVAPSTQENTSTDSGGHLSSRERVEKEEEEARQKRGDNDCVGTSAATLEGPPPPTGEDVSG